MNRVISDHDQGRVMQLQTREEQESSDSQTEHLGSVTCLNVETFCLTSVARNDGEIATSNGENGASILSVRVKLSLLRTHN